jgi:predicted CXXCH cytochrome family protein
MTSIRAFCTSSHPQKLFLLALVALMGEFNLGLAQKQPAAPEPSSVTWKGETEGKPGDYAGADKCRSCHKAETVQFSKTVHAKIEVAGKKYLSGCEACHGPGKSHADSMEAAEGNEAKIAAALKRVPIFAFRANPKENTSRCMTCHITSKDEDLFNHSEHMMHGVSCDSCHATHLVEAAEHPGRPGLAFAQARFSQMPRLSEETRWLHNSLLKKPQPDLCFSCHGAIQAQFALPMHHRVPEGLMKCTDCHTPHGSMSRAMLRKTSWEACVTCHVEKRGPFVFEHAAVRVEGCVSCHTPHGSVDRMLMLRREGRFLCLQCHVDPFAPNVPHGRLSFPTRGECVRCHVTIHGSNFNEFFLQ